jgi:hypothetical protein
MRSLKRGMIAPKGTTQFGSDSPAESVRIRISTFEPLVSSLRMPLSTKVSPFPASLRVDDGTYTYTCTRTYTCTYIHLQTSLPCAGERKISPQAVELHISNHMIPYQWINPTQISEITRGPYSLRLQPLLCSRSNNVNVCIAALPGDDPLVYVGTFPSRLNGTCRRTSTVLFWTADSMLA